MTVTLLPAPEPGVYPKDDLLERVTSMTPEELENAIDYLDWTVTPWSCGPTWDKDPNWDGPRDPDGYILPKFTLGWQAIKWAQENLLSDETDSEDRPLPFTFTAEQIRFILWFYALDEGQSTGGEVISHPTGIFKYREFVLQRLKGWG